MYWWRRFMEFLRGLVDPVIPLVYPKDTSTDEFIRNLVRLKKRLGENIRVQFKNERGILVVMLKISANKVYMAVDRDVFELDPLDRFTLARIGWEEFLENTVPFRVRILVKMLCGS